MASAAAVLFVQNDADDIGWWIAYHIALGFDALIIIDDHSTDGTWEIIHCAAGLYPIEVQRASADEGRSFAERRSEAFGQAIEASRSRFDWIICLESDEYVYLEHENSVGAYLERFANADAITLHWSIFGSNNHVVPTALAPIAAYTRRAPLDFPDHVMGKLFIRPGIVRDHKLDGSNFALGESRHVAASGISFDETSAPSWEGARILHYVARNRVHYTRRLARLPSGIVAPDLWTHFNRNDEEDFSALRFLPATRHHAARIARAGFERLFWRLRQDIDMLSVSFLPDSVFAVRERRSITTALRLDHTLIENAKGEILSQNPQTGRLYFAPSGSMEPDHLPVFLVTENAELQDHAPDHPQTGFLILPAGDNPPPETMILTRWLPVRITTDSSALCHLVTSENGTGIGQQEDGTLSLHSGQTLPVKLREIEPDHRNTEALRSYLALRSKGHSLRDFVLGLDLMHTPQVDALACAIAQLDPEARSALGTRYAGLVPLWLAAP